jgi:HD-GYP domain-containing protein (c-di-GMP phosphodiesterase class II)
MPQIEPLRRGSAHGESLEALEKFLQQLPLSRDISDQLRLTLELICTAARCDTVVMYSGHRQEVQEAVGLPANLPQQAYERASRWLLGEALDGAGQALFAEVPGRHAPDGMPFSAALVRLSRSRSVWIIAIRRAPQPPLGQREVRLMSLARKMLLQQQQQQEAHNELKEALFGLVRCLTATLDARDRYTCGHSERVARISVLLGEEMGLSEARTSELHLGGLLHDIGKVGVPDAILRKDGRLTEEEYALVREHAAIGDMILANVPQLAHLRPMVRHHHEQYDGSGYPDRLKGDAIPLNARIMAVADACDAMMSDRPYRAGMPPEMIEAIMREGAGKQWAPDVVQAWLARKDEVLAVQARGLGGSVLQAIGNAVDGGSNNGGPVASMKFISLHG